MLENLRKIQDDPCYYIDNRGNVYNSDLKVLKPHVLPNGTLGVVLQKNLEDNKKAIRKPVIISRLLLEHFVRKPSKNEIVFFIDGNKTNNELSNLKWDTRQNLPIVRSYNKGNSSNKPKFDKHIILKVKTKLSEGVSQREIAKEFNMSEAHVSRIKHGYRWSCLDNMTQDIGIKCLYTFSHDVYNATLHGMFVAARVDVKNAIGKTITINEDVIELEEHMFNELAVSDLVIESLLEATNNKFNFGTIFGYNPLEYIRE